MSSSRWMHPDTRPPHPGVYERQTLLGVTVDVWDGKLWRRPSSSHASDKDQAIGVACANQNMAWRSIEREDPDA